MSVFRKFYQCSFCRNRLDVVPISSLRFHDKLLALVGIRQYLCPHCFAGYCRVWMPAIFLKSKPAAVPVAPVNSTNNQQFPVVGVGSVYLA